MAQMALRKQQFTNTGYAQAAKWKPSINSGVALGQSFIFVNVAGLVLYSDLVDLGQDLAAITTWQLAKQFATRHSFKFFAGRISQLAAGASTARGGQLSGQFGMAEMLAAMGGF